MSHIFDMGDAAQRLRDHAETAGKRIPTGYSIDQSHGMIGRGELGLLRARSGGGKSALVLNIIARTPEVPTAYFTLEMPAHQCFAWLLSITFALNFHAEEIEPTLAAQAGPLYPRLERAMAQMGEHYGGRVSLVDPPERLTLKAIRVKCDEIYDRTGTFPQRVFIDHFGLLANTDDYGETIRAADRLHEWAQNDDLAVIALQQSTKAGDGKGSNDGHLPVTLSAGVWGGETAADFVWGVYRPSLAPKYAQAEHREEWQRIRNKSQLSVVKNRSTGLIDLRGVTLDFEPSSKRLYEVGKPTPTILPVELPTGETF